MDSHILFSLLLNLWGMTWSKFKLVSQLMLDMEKHVENAVKGN